MARHRNPSPSKPERAALAPYNFVPLPNAVWYVENDVRFEVAATGSDRRISVWQCHDRYVPGLLSGFIDVTMETVTPLFVRGPARKNRHGWDTRESRLRPEMLLGPGGRPVVPGSSFRGMLRNLVEILSFSKPQPVTDQRPFFRSVGDDRMGKQYRRRVVRNNVPPTGGFIRQTPQGWAIEPAGETLRIAHQTIRDARIAEPRLPEFKYETHPRHRPDPNYQHRDCWVIREGKTVTAVSFADPSSAEWEKGLLVLTGAAAKKKQEFVLLPAVTPASIPVPDTMWRRFHDDDQITKYQEESFRKHSHARGRDGFLRANDPVFYVTSREAICEDNPEGLLFFGRAQLFRFPYDLSPRDLVPSTLRAPAVDLAEGLFGRVGADVAIRGRVRVGDFTAEHRGDGDYFEDAIVPSILSLPKPTAFQQYLVQNGHAGKDELQTYLAGDNTVIRGHKLYWRRWDEGGGLDSVLLPQAKQDEIRGALRAVNAAEDKRYKQYTLIRPVKAHRTFKGRIAFDNLTRLELGALMTALALPDGGLHSIGMGRPLGLGAVSLTPLLCLVDRDIRYSSWSNSGETVADPQPYIDAFTEAILDHARRTGEPLLHTTTVWGVARLDALRILLTHRPSLEQTRYLRITDGMAPYPENEYRERPVLPTPHFIAGLDEPAWTDSPGAAASDRELRVGDIVDAVVLDERGSKGKGRRKLLLPNGQKAVLHSMSYDKFPEDLEPGTSLRLRVKVLDKAPQLEWFDPDAPVPSPSASPSKRKPR